MAPFNLYQHAKEHGQLQAEVKALKDTVARQAMKLANLEDSRSQLRGMWKALLTVGTIAGSVAAILTRVLYK